jgi:hypothetical protein
VFETVVLMMVARVVMRVNGHAMMVVVFLLLTTAMDHLIMAMLHGVRIVQMVLMK